MLLHHCRAVGKGRTDCFSPQPRQVEVEEAWALMKERPAATHTRCTETASSNGSIAESSTRAPYDRHLDSRCGLRDMGTGAVHRAFVPCTGVAEMRGPTVTEAGQEPPAPRCECTAGPRRCSTLVAREYGEWICDNPRQLLHLGGPLSPEEPKHIESVISPFIVPIMEVLRRSRAFDGIASATTHVQAYLDAR